MAEKCAEYFERFRRRTFVTPKSFLSFIDSYKVVYTQKMAHLGTLAERMRTGRRSGGSMGGPTPDHRLTSDGHRSV